MAETYIITVTAMHLIMMGMYSEKCVIRKACCAKIVEWTSTVLGDVVYNYNFMFYLLRACLHQRHIRHKSVVLCYDPPTVTIEIVQLHCNLMEPLGTVVDLGCNVIVQRMTLL